MIFIADDLIPKHPAWLVLSASAHNVLLLILHRWLDSGRRPVILPYGSICDSLHMSRSTVARAVKELEQIGWIEVDRGEGSSRQYSYYSISDIWKQFTGRDYWLSIEQRQTSGQLENLLAGRHEMRQVEAAEKKEEKRERDYRNSLGKLLERLDKKRKLPPGVVPQVRAALPVIQEKACIEEGAGRP